GALQLGDGDFDLLRSEPAVISTRRVRDAVRAVPSKPHAREEVWVVLEHLSRVQYRGAIETAQIQIVLSGGITNSKSVHRSFDVAERIPCSSPLHIRFLSNATRIL